MREYKITIDERPDGATAVEVSAADGEEMPTEDALRVMGTVWKRFRDIGFSRHKLNRFLYGFEEHCHMVE